MNILPEEYYIKHGTTRQNCIGVSDAYAKQTANNTRGLNVLDSTWRSILPLISFNGKNSPPTIKIHPILLNRYGLPTLSNDITILEDIINLSACYGTKIEIAGNYAVVKSTHNDID